MHWKNREDDTDDTQVPSDTPQTMWDATPPATAPRTFDIWLGVRFSVEATDSGEAEQKATQWLREALRNGRTDAGVTADDLPLNLVHTAVRLLNEQGEEARRREREQKAERLIDSAG